MGDTSSTPTLSNTTVLEVASKIIISAVIVLFIVIAIISILHIYTRVFWSSSSYEAPYILNWRRQQAATTTTTTNQRRRSGLDKSTLDSLPVISYNMDDSNLKEMGGHDCAICLCELQKGEKVRFLPKCNHGFHLDCIDIWFKSHSSCPICRDDLVVIDSHRRTVLTPPISSGDGEEDHQNSGVDNTDDPSVVSFPTNVLFWGDETSGVRSGSEKDGQSSVASTSCNNNNGGGGNGVLVIDIPAELCEDCSGLSTPTPDQDESGRSLKPSTPVVFVFVLMIEIIWASIADHISHSTQPLLCASIHLFASFAHHHQQRSFYLLLSPTTTNKDRLVYRSS